MTDPRDERPAVDPEAAERDQGVTEPDDCPICDPPDPGPCLVHGEPEKATECRMCHREAFSEWLARVGTQRICDGSGMRDGARFLACPGCAACCTSATTCPAFWDDLSVTGCLFCGGMAGAHRRLPELPPPEPIRGFHVVSVIDDTADPSPRSLILRASR
jgi:hypothetical protein